MSNRITGGRLCSALADVGWRNQANQISPASTHKVLVAMRRRLSTQRRFNNRFIDYFLLEVMLT